MQKNDFGISQKLEPIWKTKCIFGFSDLSIPQKSISHSVPFEKNFLLTCVIIRQLTYINTLVFLYSINLRNWPMKPLRDTALLWRKNKQSSSRQRQMRKQQPHGNTERKVQPVCNSHTVWKRFVRSNDRSPCSVSFQVVWLWSLHRKVISDAGKQ